MASGTAPSPLYFINSNTHSCPAMLFPECPTAVLSSGLQPDGTFYGCFYNVGGILHFSRIQEMFFFPVKMLTFSCKFRCKKSSKLQQGVSDKHITSHRKLKAKFWSGFTSSHITYNYAPEAGSERKRKKEKEGHITSRLFNFLFWIWTVRWQKRIKKTARLCFEDRIKALYIFWCPSFTLNELGLPYTFQTILLSSSSSVLVPSMPFTSNQAAPRASLKLQVLSYMQNRLAHKSLIF